MKILHNLLLTICIVYVMLESIYLTIEDLTWESQTMHLFDAFKFAAAAGFLIFLRKKVK